MSVSNYNNLGLSKYLIKNASVTLTSFTGENVSVVGKCNLACTFTKIKCIWSA